jgi:uncharacterized membrane protein YccC
VNVRCYKGAKEALEQAIYAELGPKYKKKAMDVLRELQKLAEQRKGSEYQATKQFLTQQLQSLCQTSPVLKKAIQTSQPLGYYVMLLSGEFNLQESDVIA